MRCMVPFRVPALSRSQLDLVFGTDLGVLGDEAYMLLKP